MFSDTKEIWSVYGVKEELDAIVATACHDVLEIIAPKPVEAESLKLYLKNIL